MPTPCKTALLALLIVALPGCSVLAVGGAVVGVAATAVSTTVSVGATVVTTTVKAGGAVVDAVAGGADPTD